MYCKSKLLCLLGCLLLSRILNRTLHLTTGIGSWNIHSLLRQPPLALKNSSCSSNDSGNNNNNNNLLQALAAAIRGLSVVYLISFFLSFLEWLDSADHEFVCYTTKNSIHSNRRLDRICTCWPLFCVCINTG